MFFLKGSCLEYKYIWNKKINSNRFAVNDIHKEEKVKKEIKHKDDNGKDFTFPNGQTGVKHIDDSYQVYTTVGLSRKFKKKDTQYTGLFKPSHVGVKRKFDDKKPKRENVHMEALVKKRLEKFQVQTVKQFVPV